MRGFARNRSRYNVQLQDLQGKFHLLDARRRSRDIAMEPGSMMPAARCSAEECRDLLAYLSSLTGPPVGPSRQGARKGRRPIVQTDRSSAARRLAHVSRKHQRQSPQHAG